MSSSSNNFGLSTVSAVVSIAPGTTITTELSPTVTNVTPVISVNIDLTPTQVTSQTTFTALASTRTTQYINVGPLTTTFSHPTKCATLLGHEWLLDSPALINWHPTCRTAEDADCYPPRTTLKPAKALTTVKTLEPTVSFYSPGILCPSGWTTAYTSAGGKAASIPTPTPAQLQMVPEPQLDPDQTLAICCPSSYDVGGLYCTSTTAVSSVASLCQLPVSTGTDGSITVAGPVLTVLPMEVATLTHPAIEVQYPVVLVYKQTDLTVSGTPKSTQTPAQTPNAGSTGTPRPGARLAIALVAASFLLGFMN